MGKPTSRAGAEAMTIPALVALEAVRVRYDPPARHWVGGKYVDLKEGIEIRIETDRPIPVRALAPALFVGAAEVTESREDGKLRTRFFVIDEALVAGAPILLGWIGLRPPEAAFSKAKFRYAPPPPL